MSRTQSVLPLLLDAAFADSHFKVVGKIYECKRTRWLDSTTPQDEYLEPAEYSDKHRYDRNHPYYHACDNARELAQALGQFCKVNDIDLSASPMVMALRFKDAFTEAYEKNRVVHVDVLTPKVLHDAVEKRNVLHWEGWTIKAGKQDECADAYGLPTFVRPLVAQHNDGKPAIELWLPGESTKRAREAFHLITGSAFAGDDGLEADPLHMYEHMCAFNSNAFSQEDDREIAMADAYGFALYEAPDDDWPDESDDDDPRSWESIYKAMPFEKRLECDLAEMADDAMVEIYQMCDAALHKINSYPEHV